MRPEFRFLFCVFPCSPEARGAHFFPPGMSDGSESEEWRSVKVPSEGVGRNQPRPIDEIASVSSDSSGAPQATTARWYEAFATRVAPSQTTRRSVSSEPAKTQLRSKRTRLPGGDLKVGRENHCCLRSECRSEGRPRGACFSKDVRDAGGSLVDRKHKRVHSRMTDQGLVDAVAGDRRTDRHLDTGIDVPATSPSSAEPFFPGWEAGALASRARETSHECTISHR